MATSLSPPTSPPYDNLPRPRTTSALSYVSNRSRRSSGSGKVEKMDMTEYSSDKKRLNTKANPNRALNEAQPAAVALEESNLEDLRLIQHKDADGNIISDPDRSNPTRHRLERPLDTIRSFQAAAEGTSHSRRSTYAGRQPSQIGSQVGSQAGFDGAQNRRSSYYGSNGFSPSPQRNRPGMGGGYYRNSSYGYGGNGFRPDSFVEETPMQAQAASYNYSNRGPPGRQVSGPSYYNQTAEAPSPVHSHQQSYDNMTSGSDENTNKSTNPSSQNSSFDRLHQLRNMKHEERPSEYDSAFAPVNPPKPTGFMYNPNDNQAPRPDYGGPQNIYSYPQNMQPGPALSSNQMAAPNNPRVPIRLNGGSNMSPEDEYGLRKTNSTAKRQSWLKRAFSRGGS